MDRRTYLRSTSGLATGAMLAGCLGLGGSTGTLATQVSDQPGDIGDFSECIITIDKIHVKSAGTDGGDDQSEKTIDAGGATADLVQLQGENATLVAEESLPSDECEHLKLAVSNVGATLKQYEDATGTTPGDAPLKSTKQFRIDNGK